MHDIAYAGSVRRFVDHIDDVAQRLEFADELGGDRWPMSGDIVSLRRLLDELRAAASTRGRTGANVYRLAAQAVDQLIVVVEAHDAGDLSPWRSCRGSVLESVASLRQLCEPEHDELVVRSAIPVATALRQAMPETIDQEQHRGEEVHKAEKASADIEKLVEKMPTNARKVVRHLRREHATSMVKRWTQAEIADAVNLSTGQIRRAMEWLREHGLTHSHAGQDGGVWLSQSGVAVAARIEAAPPQ